MDVQQTFQWTDAPVVPAPTLEERFASTPEKERQVAIAVYKHKRGLRWLLQMIASGNAAHSPAERDQAVALLGSFIDMGHMDVAKSILSFNISTRDTLLSEPAKYALLEVRRAYKRWESTCS